MRLVTTVAALAVLAGGALAQSMAPPATCMPFNGGQVNTGDMTGFNSLQSYCEGLMKKPSSYFDTLFTNAPKPAMTYTEGFPLKGCIVGCMVGSNPGFAGWRHIYRFGGGGFFWNGDCYHGYNGTNQVFPSAITLYLTPLAGSYGKIWTAPRTSGVAVPVIKGKLKYMTNSWWDNQPSYTMRFPFPMTDEMRYLAPGAMIGKSSADPTFGKRQVGGSPNGPLMSNFIFWQVCSKRNPANYPFTMEDRAIF